MHSFGAPELLAVFVLFVAYLVRGICGFGSGLIAIPVLSLLLPIQMAVPLVVMLDFLASAGQGGANRKLIQLPEVGTLLPFALAGVGIGITLFQVLDATVLKVALGVFVICYALYSFWEPTVRPVSRFWAAPAGLAGGTVGTLFGTGGPFFVTYLKARGLDKSQFRATFAAVFLIDASFRISGYLGTGIVTVDLLRWLAMGMPIMVAGMYLGGHLHTNIPPRTFSIAISVLLLFSGVGLMI